MKTKKVHFIGIGGSGISGCAMIANELGYEVTGCDIQESTPYIDMVRDSGIKVEVGHSEKHLLNCDYVVTTPAAFYLNPDHPEILVSKSTNNLQTWESFLGKVLMVNKKTIAIAGTHGKSTTTALTSLLLEKVGFDPSVMIGAKVSDWGKNYRAGKGNFFIVEADEFYNNFLNYDPDILILNNIEFDHPDFFTNEDSYFESFRKLIAKLKGEKILIYNYDDPGIQKLLKRYSSDEISSYKLITYSLKDKNADYFADEISESEIGSRFKVLGKLGSKQEISLNLLGVHNISNSLGVVALADQLKIKHEQTNLVMSTFSGIGRRLQKVGEINGAHVYDDYAHHPTAIKATLKALKKAHPNKKIIAVVEPHTFSRTKALLLQYKDAFIDADQVLLMPIYKSRDTSNYGINLDSIIKVSKHPNIKGFDESAMIVYFVKSTADSNTIILVMGAGESYKIAKEIANK